MNDLLILLPNTRPGKCFLLDTWQLFQKEVYLNMYMVFKQPDGPGADLTAKKLYL